MTGPRGMTPDLIFRSLKASLALIGLFGLLAWARLGGAWASSFVFFGAWSVANLWLLARLLILVVERGTKTAILLRGAGLVGLLAILVLYFALKGPKISAFAWGFHLPYAVIVLKALGWNLTRHAGPEQRSGGGAAPETE